MQVPSTRSARRIFRRLAFHISLLVFWLSPLLSPAHAAPLRALHFEQLSVKQGLAQETVTTIVQDPQGFMWFGSQNGLSRFDGYQVTVYKNIPNDPRSLADNWVQALYIDEDDRLWVGTRGGLQRFDTDQGDFSHFLPRESRSSGNGQRHVRAIAGDGHGGLWLATNNGLQHFDPRSGFFSVMRHDPADTGSISDDNIIALAGDRKGNLWAGTKEGIDLLAAGSKRFRHFRFESADASGAPPYEVQSLWVGHDQSLWIVTALGLENWHLDANSLRKYRYGAADGLQPGMITAFCQDSNGNPWVGTNTHGLHYWDASAHRFVAYPADPHGVADNEVSALYQDRSGTLWVGTWTAGVKRADLASGGFSRFFHAPADAESLSDNRIYGITGDSQGQLWLGTFGNLDQLDSVTGKVTHFRRDRQHENSLNNDEVVLSVFRDRHGQLWLGTSAGLGRFDPVANRLALHFFHTGDSNSESITHIASDHVGNLWISTRGGLHRLDTSTGIAQTYRHDAANASSLGENWVRMTLEDDHGSLWVATDNGLDRLDPASGRFMHFRHAPGDAYSLGSDRVQCLFKDKEGHLWIGTNGGLNRMETLSDGTVRFRVYTTREGLGADSIGGILEDDNGHLWLSTATGISRFDIATKTFRNYTAQDGMIEGYYYVGSAFRDSDGTMYFGGVNGLTAFRPENIRENPYPPHTVITDIQISGRSIHNGNAPEDVALNSANPDAGALTMSYRHSVFSLAFSALHYADPQRNRFTYQLQGFDKDWVNADASNRVATYTNLDPGHYIFHVRSANKDGVWDEHGATLAVIITPPFWKTWWFRIAAVLMMAGSAWLAYRVRIRALTGRQKSLEEQVTARTSEAVHQKKLVEQKNALLEQQKKQLQTAQEQLQRYVADRERLFVSISHDLRTPITRLKLRSELLEDDGIRTEFHDDLDDLDMMVKGALQRMKDSDIHENPTEIRLDTLIGRMIRSAQLAQYRVSYVESGLSVRAKPLALKRAIGNLLDNALFYGGSAEISVHAFQECIEIRIRDHGPGVDETAIEHLFESHVRLPHGRDRNAQGLGLGLGIARTIILAHEGKLILANHPDGGLIAIIRLPKIA